MPCDVYINDDVCATRGQVGGRRPCPGSAVRVNLQGVFDDYLAARPTGSTNLIRYDCSRRFIMGKSPRRQNWRLLLPAECGETGDNRDPSPDLLRRPPSPLGEGKPLLGVRCARPRPGHGPVRESLRDSRAVRGVSTLPLLLGGRGNSKSGQNAKKAIDNMYLRHPSLH